MANVRLGAAYQIAVNYAAVFAWAVLVLGLTVHFAVNADIDRQRDREISAELERLSREPSRPELLRELAWRQNGGVMDGFRYALFDRGGKRVAGTLDIARPATTGLHPLPEAIATKEAETRRLGVVDAADGTRLAISAGRGPSEPVSQLLMKYFLITFAGLLLANMVGGLLLARYLRLRLQPISATANAIVSGDLGQRVPIGPRGDEFDEAGQALNLMLDRIAGLMENLRQVSSDIAHDLRKPLIRLLCQTDRLGEVEGAEERVLAMGDEMLALFSSILRIAEVEGGGLERSFEEIDLSQLMAEVSESFEPALTDAGDVFSWAIEPDIAVLGNKELLGQLAANLLDNARIHTPAGTAIRLSLSAEGTRVVLAVEDNGPGVREEDRAKLLQRFFRADSSRSTPGNGLGLSLVAAAAGVHGGGVDIRNLNPGLRISVTLARLGAEQDSGEEPGVQRRPLLSFLQFRQ
jgi:signal transduction histidine kinase